MDSQKKMTKKPKKQTLNNLFRTFSELVIITGIYIPHKMRHGVSGKVGSCSTSDAEDVSYNTTNNVCTQRKLCLFMSAATALCASVSTALIKQTCILK